MTSADELHPVAGGAQRTVVRRPWPEHADISTRSTKPARRCRHRPRQPQRLRPRRHQQDSARSLVQLLDKVRNADLDTSGDKLGEVVRIARSLNLDSFPNAASCRSSAR